MKRELTVLNSKKYLNIVKNGNYDDMFDFGYQAGIEATLEKIEQQAKDYENAMTSGDEQTTWNSALRQCTAKLRALIKQLRS